MSSARVGRTTVVFLVALLSAAPVGATPLNTWLGPANAVLVWSDGTNWSLGHPADGSIENISIAQGGITGDFSFTNINTFSLNAANLSIQSTTTVTNAGTMQTAGAVTNAGTLANAAGGTLTGSVNFNNNAGGTLTNDGTVSVATGALTNNAGATFMNTGNAGTGTSNSVVSGFGTLANAGNVTNTGTLGTNMLTNQAGAAVTNTGTLASIFVSNGGTLVNVAGGTLTGPLVNFTNTAGGTLLNTGNVSADQGSLFVNNAGATFTNNGNAGTGSVNSVSIGLGTLVNAGAVTNTVTLGTNTLFNQAGGALTNTGTLASLILTNAGTFNNAAGGTLTGPLNFSNTAGGTLTNNGNVSAAQGALTNDAGATFANTGNAGTGASNSIAFGFGTVTNAGMVANTGTLGTNTLTNQVGGTLINAGTLASVSLINAGTLINAPGGTLTGPLSFTNDAGGTFVNGGNVSAIVLTTIGSFVEQIGGIGLADFGGVGAHDIVLGGLLDVELFGGFIPASGDRFDFITFSGTRTGAFAGENFPALPPGLSWRLTYDDSHGDVVLEVTGSPTNSVPEPVTVTLLTGGIVGLFLSETIRAARR